MVAIGGNGHLELGVPKLCHKRSRCRKSVDNTSYVFTFAMRRSGVRSSSAPPYPRSPTILRWAFLCLEGQCWRHSGPLSQERGLSRSAVLGRFSASLLSLFSAVLRSVLAPFPIWRGFAGRRLELEIAGHATLEIADARICLRCRPTMGGPGRSIMR